MPAKSCFSFSKGYVCNWSNNGFMPKKERKTALGLQAGVPQNGHAAELKIWSVSVQIRCKYVANAVQISGGLVHIPPRARTASVARRHYTAAQHVYPLKPPN